MGVMVQNKAERFYGPPASVYMVANIYSYSHEILLQNVQKMSPTEKNAKILRNGEVYEFSSDFFGSNDYQRNVGRSLTVADAADAPSLSYCVAIIHDAGQIFRKSGHEALQAISLHCGYK